MTDTAIRTLEYEAGVRDQELADLRLRVVQLESAAGFVVRRAELASSDSLRERIETLRSVLDTVPASGTPLSRGDGFRYFANELIDAIATPTGRNFRHAWDEACLFFGRSGAEPTLLSPLLKLAEATRLYVSDDDEDRVETWDAMVKALDEALQALPDPAELPTPLGNWRWRRGYRDRVMLEITKLVHGSDLRASQIDAIAKYVLSEVDYKTSIRDRDIESKDDVIDGAYAALEDHVGTERVLGFDPVHGETKESIPLRECIDRLIVDSLVYRGALEKCIRTLLASAVPHPVEHPTMWKAWREAEELIGATETGSEE